MYKLCTYISKGSKKTSVGGREQLDQERKRREGEREGGREGRRERGGRGVGEALNCN